MGTAVLQRQSVYVGGVPFDAVVLGEGPVTVVFVNGLGAPLEEWSLVAPTIADGCRIVCYDRRSAPHRGPVLAHDAAQIADDLRDLLKALDVTGPLVLVGHSWGGSVIRRYAVAHPDAVQGLVFVDASHEKIKGMTPTRFSELLYTTSTTVLRVGPIRRRLMRTLGFEHLPAAELSFVDKLPWVADGRTARAEYAGIGTSLRELSDIAPELPAVPTCVLLAGGRPNWVTKLGAKQLAKIRAVWEQAVAGRPEIILEVVPDSGHYISLDQPQAVIDAINDVVNKVSLRQAS
jgi:pimeloyl-ACP methyl ester carboxylesterase